MPIDPSIPLQVRLPEIENPQNALMRALQMQNAQRENDLGQMKMDEYRRGTERQNRLDQLLQTAPDAATLRRNGYLKEANDLDKNAADVGKTKAETTKNTAEAATKKLSVYRDTMFNIGDAQTAAQLITAMHQDPDLKGSGIDAVPLEKLLAQIPQDPNQFAAFKQQFSLGAEKFMADMRAREGHAVTMRGQDITSDTTRRGQDMTDSRTREEGAANRGVTVRGQNLTDSRAREGNAIQREAARTQLLSDPTQGPLLIDKGTGSARPVTMNGARVPGEVPAKQAASANKTLPLLDQADTLIDQATGSYAGAGIDAAARTIGKSPAGADAIAKLKVLEGQIMMSQPRMEGPQSDKDVVMYRQMAGQIGDPTVPRDMKKAAIATIRDINQRYAGGQQQSAPKAGGLSPAEQAELQKLRERFKK